MFDKLNPIVIVAFFTSVALIAFAFYQRHGASVPISAVRLYVAAAIICLSPVVYARVFRKTCRNKTSNAS